MASSSLIWLQILDGERYAARCGCGWRTPALSDTDQARAAATAHQAAEGHQLGGSLDVDDAGGDWSAAVKRYQEAVERERRGPGSSAAPLEMSERELLDAAASIVRQLDGMDDLRAWRDRAARGPDGRWFHSPCGWVHGWREDCPTAATSPRGRVRRVLTGQPTERLAAVRELAAWLDEQEREAVVAARLARVSWRDIGDAYGGLSRQAAHNRWGAMVGRMEAAGLLDPPADADDAAPPLVPEWADLRSAVTWCRWCGQRLGMVSGQPGWTHCTPGSLDVRADDFHAAGELDAACTGPEPWPARQPWPDDPPDSQKQPAAGQPFTAGDRVRPASPAVRVGSVDGQRRPTEGTVRGHHEGHIRVQWDGRTSDDLYKPSDLEHLS